MTERLIIFDLDGTCYPQDSALTRIIDERTTEFLLNRAGLTSAELAAMEDRTPSILKALALLDIPRVQWATAVYEAVPYQQLLRQDPALNRALSRIAAHRIVVTMAPQRHALAVLGALGLTAAIDNTISVYESDHTDKHDIYQALVKEYGASRTTVVGDNEALDLDPAAALGCGCAHIDPRGRSGAYPVFRDLAQALVALP
ncbi:HAD family hydrolase [Nocardia fluminea]|uniref:HAD family hydrolase n=1 Tax=Nocardia fluminea TaxID=134984 RepID=UPI0033FA0BFB